MPDLANIDLDELSWRKSSYSNGAGGMCVQAAWLDDGTVLVRNLKMSGEVAVAFSADEWTCFVRGVKANEFDSWAGSNGHSDLTPR
nr:DUF397 domain-containing protein [Frankia sp. Cppng1_Ct_nod]